MNPHRPTVVALDLADPPAAWEALGFTVESDRLHLGGISVNLGASGSGITAWTLRGLSRDADLDGLPTTIVDETEPEPSAHHPNGALAIDHVVVATPEFDRTKAALEGAGLPLRRIRDAGGFRQGFRRLGPAILELVEAHDASPGPARFWGLVVIVEDLDALAARLGDQLSPVRPAVQPGRHIAALRRAAGLTVRVAFMDPEPRATLA